MKKKRGIIILFCILTFLWICFIWGNSLKPGSESGEMSNFVLEFINSILKNISPSLMLSHLFVRKLAHFLEFAALGVLASFLIYFLFGLSREASVKKLAFVFFALPFSFMVASIDEVIQLFVAGRSGNFGDVMIDTSGASVAIVIFFAILLLRYELHNSKRSEI